MNKVLRLLIVSDLFILGSFGLVSPIMAVFYVREISGATVSAIGLSLTIQLFVRGVVQLAVGRWADCERGNCRELYALVAGSIIISLVPLLYIFAHTMWFVYIIQVMYGFGGALIYPTWRVIFMRHTQSDKAGYEWGIYDTVTSLSIAAAATIGGVLVEQISFRGVFVIVSVLSLIGTYFLVKIFKQELTCKLVLKKA